MMNIYIMMITPASSEVPGARCHLRKADIEQSRTKLSPF